jgi:HEAT repeat protein
MLDSRVFVALCDVHDRAVIPYLQHFAESQAAFIRVRAIMGLREIADLASAPTFLRALSDPREDIGFISMHALIELAGGGQIVELSRFEELSANPKDFDAKVREWWRTEGERKAKERAARHF